MDISSKEAIQTTTPVAQQVQNSDTGYGWKFYVIGTFVLGAVSAASMAVTIYVNKKHMEERVICTYDNIRDEIHELKTAFLLLENKLLTEKDQEIKKIIDTLTIQQFSDYWNEKNVAETSLKRLLLEDKRSTNYDLSTAFLILQKMAVLEQLLQSQHYIIH